MEVFRREIMPAVMLTCLKTDKFKTGYISINLLTQLTRENAPVTALVPKVLSRGTKTYPDIKSLSRAMCGMFGARINPAVRKFGEIQAVGFTGSFINDSFVPEGEHLLERVTELMGEMLLSPETRGGLLLPSYTESEKEKLLESIRGRVNDKRGYALLRMLENMCCYEDYSVPAYGFEDECESVNYKKLTRRWKELLAQAPVEIFFCGSAEPERVERAFREALLNLPRGEIDYEMGTDIRMNSVEERERVFTEEMDVNQGKLSVGFRLGECMEDPDFAAIRVFNAVYGGCLTSKLFMNVREKLSLAYYAGSSVDIHKGIMCVNSGIEFDKYDAALSEIFAQLDAVRRGEITDEELENAKRSLATDLRTTMDSQAGLEYFCLAHMLEGVECLPDEMAGLVELVTKQDVIDIAGSVECDAVYFLRGEE